MTDLTKAKEAIMAGQANSFSPTCKDGGIIHLVKKEADGKFRCAWCGVEQTEDN